MTENKDVKVMGADYKIKESDKLEGLDGETDFYSHTIEIRSTEDMLEENCERWKKELRKKEVLRHELIHAMFERCGLSMYAHDEILVEWIAQKFEELLGLFGNCGAL